MDQIEFVEKLKKYGIDQNHAIYKEIFAEPLGKDATNAELVHFMNIYQSLDQDKQTIVLDYLKQVITDSVGIILSLLDGSSNIGQTGKFKLYYEATDGQTYLINNRKGDCLMTLLYEDDE